MALHILGDMHFMNSHEWDKLCMERFLDYFEGVSVSTNDDLLLEGDITHSKFNDSITIDCVSKFISIALKKYDNIYIIGGNHDMFEDEHHNIEYTTKYLKHFAPDRIHLIYDETVLDIKGLKVLALPHKKSSAIELDEYYNHNLDKKFYETEYDLIVGHTTIFDPEIPVAGGVELDRFKTKYAYFGHVHIRFGTQAKHYTGSIMPVKKTENGGDLCRCLAIVSKDGIKEIDLPVIKKFEEVDLIDGIPTNLSKKGDSPVVIYDFKNCNNETIESLRKDYFIRYEKDVIKGIETEISQDDGNKTIVNKLFNNFYDAYKLMCRENNITPKRAVDAIMKRLLIEID
ncbi:MAG: metallophosphoesterase [Clostridia bacterium]|nr:metallophosphoesterase [Clostridia bacterium]